MMPQVAPVPVPMSAAEAIEVKALPESKGQLGDSRRSADCARPPWVSCRMACRLAFRDPPY
jgi:hypothetical protein